MDDPKQSEVEVASPITPDKDDSPPGGSVPGLRHASGLFLRSRQFSVSGGTFTNVTNIHRASDSPVDFRVIPLGDLDLLCKIDRGSGVVRRHRAEQAFTRRVYTARIPGLQSKVTAAVYQGDGAEEEWREEITRYANFRHPNVVQLYGVVKTQNLHAAVFHDDLIPCQDLKAKYYHSHVSAVYFWASLQTAFSDVNNYMRPLLHRNLVTRSVLQTPSAQFFPSAGLNTPSGYVHRQAAPPLPSHLRNPTTLGALVVTPVSN
ncbi:hypothetical protein DFH06DRAFT_511701 [Mycena polygramma]|nr:hypothetical protein DFH06DRAFT_511701 [Mycena polygramma]